VSRIVQQKFEVRYPDTDSKNEEGVQGWTPDIDARGKKGMPGREGPAGGDGATRFMNDAVMFNSLPPGMDIEDQEVCDIRQMGINLSGNFPTELAQGDVTNGEVHAKSLRKGFDRKKLLNTDDEYYREHNDLFYDTIYDDQGNPSFVERGNFLDRL
jgi:hypothetical protein